MALVSDPRIGRTGVRGNSQTRGDRGRLSRMMRYNTLYINELQNCVMIVEKCVSMWISAHGRFCIT